jgi:DNA-binding transcriptional regulator GbsR (MarR family)
MKKRFYQLGNCFWELPISAYARIVLGFLRSQLPGYNSSLNHIAKRTHMSVSVIRKSIAELEKMKLIKVKKVKGRHNDFYFPPDDYWAELAEPNMSVQDICEEHIEEETVSISDTPAKKDCITSRHTLYQDMTHTVSQSDTDCITLVHTNNTKHNTNYKTKDNTKVGRDESRQTSQKKFLFEDWHLKMAQLWHHHFKNISPNSPDQNLEKWANEIRLTAKQFKLDEKMFNAVFDFVENDSFWATNAISPMGLRTKNKAFIPKLTNILKAMPEYNRERLRHNAASGKLTRQQEKANEILKGLGW